MLQSMGAAHKASKRNPPTAPKRKTPRPANAEASASAAPPFLVAGVGASAGGLEAFSLILRPIPADAPLALVLVQHLARDHQSLLAELLATKTALVVAEARDNQLIQPGHVYVIPPDAHMTVIDGHLRLQTRPRGPEVPGAIDLFFSSLAEQYREKAVGVILSGSGNDGSFGIREIHAAGGLTFVQAPTEAQLNGMPRAAIATGASGLVLPASEIAIELLRLSHDKFFHQPLARGDLCVGPEDNAKEDPDEHAQLRTLFQRLLQATGVDFGQYKLPTIRRRIQRRMALHRLRDLASYLALLETSPAEVENLHDDILIHVTGFFREPEAFSVFGETALPSLLTDLPASSPIRAWVPACSSGEEAYSLAITLTDQLERRTGSPEIQIFGTDVSDRMIDRARAGLYPESIASQVSPEHLRRFFLKVEAGYRVSTSLRERCVFARQDVTRDPPFSRMDVVLCRNLLIYLGVAPQRKMISVFHYALNPNGFLILGRSETIGAYADLFAPLDTRARIYKRKPGRQSVGRSDVLPSPSPRSPKTWSLPRHSLMAGVTGGGRWDSAVDARQLLLDRFAPPTMILDEDFRLLRTHGHITPYLELPRGEASLDALRLARPSLTTALGSVLQDARERGAPSRKKAVPLRSDGKQRRIDLEAIPIGKSESRQYLVVFEDAAARRTTDGIGAKPALARRKAGSGARTRAAAQLQEELAASARHMEAMVQDLGAANEELQSANEEILSSNEELQSTNEELDTAREELQSTNEELSTVNDELQARNGELSRANSDLVNVLSNVQIAIVIVTDDLKIRHVTPAAEKILNVMLSDVGRPIGHIKPNIGNVDLEVIIRSVVDTGMVVEREVEDRAGSTFVLRARPYKDVDNRLDGVVLTLFDVSSALETARRIGEAIIARVRDPILLLDADRRVRRANRAFCEMFRVSPEDTEGRLVFELGDGQWNIPALRQLLQDVLPQRKNFEDFLVEHDFPGIGHKKILLDGERIESNQIGVGVILLIIRNVSNGKV
jgi:two-component system CheB/CheR fusion protein